MVQNQTPDKIVIADQNDRESNFAKLIIEDGKAKIITKGVDLHIEETPLTAYGFKNSSDQIVQNFYDYLDHFYISSGIYAGNFRSYRGTKITFYFSLRASAILSSILVGPNLNDQDYILPQFKNTLDHVVFDRVDIDSTAVSLGNKIISGTTPNRYIWEVTTAGTTAATSTIPSSPTIGDTHTDGTAVLTARIQSQGSAKYMLYDTNDDLTGLEHPDSMDTYALGPIKILAERQRIKKDDYTMLAGASNAPGSVSYQSIVDNLYVKNIKDNFSGNLVKVFQGGVNPSTGNVDNTVLTHDNAFVYSALKELKDIYDVLGDTTREDWVDDDITKLETGIDDLWESNPGDSDYGRYAWNSNENVSEAVAGQDTRAKCLAQWGLLRYCGDLIPADRRKQMVKFCREQIPDRWIDPDTLNFFNPNITWEEIAYEILVGGNIDVINQNVNRLERDYFPNKSEYIVIEDFAIYLRSKYSKSGRL